MAFLLTFCIGEYKERAEYRHFHDIADWQRGASKLPPNNQPIFWGNINDLDLSDTQKLASQNHFIQGIHYKSPS